MVTQLVGTLLIKKLMSTGRIDQIRIDIRLGRSSKKKELGKG